MSVKEDVAFFRRPTFIHPITASKKKLSRSFDGLEEPGLQKRHFGFGHAMNKLCLKPYVRP